MAERYNTLASRTRMAAIGAALLAAVYLINNVLPLVRLPGQVSFGTTAVVIATTVLPPAVWTIWFLTLHSSLRRGSPVASYDESLRTAAMAVIGLALVPQTAFVLVRQASTLSLLSIDTWSFVFTEVIQPVAWIALLAGFAAKRRVPLARLAAMMLVLISLALAILALVGFVPIWSGTLAESWGLNPIGASWRLVATPLILSFYWFTQWAFAAEVFGGRTPLLFGRDGQRSL